MSQVSPVLAQPRSARELPVFRVVSPPELSAEPLAKAQLALTPELSEEISRESQRLEDASPQEILRWATGRFAPRFTMATAFGPEGMVLVHMLAEIAPDTPIFNLDTGYQF